MVSARCWHGEYPHWLKIDPRGFGRYRISVLLRGVELRFEKQLLGWDVGTFEFISNSIFATDVDSSEVSKLKLKMRTGGSTRKVARRKANKIDNGVKWTGTSTMTHVSCNNQILFQIRGMRKTSKVREAWLSRVQMAFRDRSRRRLRQVLD